jgi:hypothetical protein
MLMSAAAARGVPAPRSSWQTKLPDRQQAARDLKPDAPAPAGTGVIAGTLVAADSGRPVRRARVNLTSTDLKLSRSAMTGDQGVFTFDELPAGLFTLTAAKAGYLAMVYGQKRPGAGRPGTSIRLAAGQRLDRLTMSIPKAGVITGVILDEAGDPAFGTPVRVLRWVMHGGERTLQQAAPIATADDRGVYRVPSLEPGEYVVSAVPKAAADAATAEIVKAQFALQLDLAKRQVAAQGGAVEELKGLSLIVPELPVADPVEGYVPVFYPGTTMASAASTVTLGISEERAGIDIQLQVVPLARVSGVVLGPEGAAAGAQVALSTSGQAASGSPARTMSSGPDGRFSLGGVAPGQYTLAALAKPKAAKVADGRLVTGITGGETRWAAMDLSVNGANVPDVTLALQPGLTVSGALAFDGPPPPASLFAKMMVMFVSVGEGGALMDGAGVSQAPVDATGHFKTTGALPGRYRVTVTPAPPGWTLKSAVFGGRDALDFLLEVKPGDTQTGGMLTFTTRTTELAGVLQDGSGAPTSDFTIVVFAADSRYWTPQSRRVQSVRPASDGRFSVTGLPPGEYRLVALGDVDPGQWSDPALLREIAPVSIPVTLAEGERKLQDLRIK